MCSTLNPDQQYKVSVVAKLPQTYPLDLRKSPFRKAPPVSDRLGESPKRTNTLTLSQTQSDPSGGIDMPPQAKPLRHELLQLDRKHHLSEPNSYESLMKVFQKVFQQKNKPDINVINQLFINPVQITPAH